MQLVGRVYADRSCASNEAIRREDGFPILYWDLELGSWYKHPDLHGYIIQHFAGGEDVCQDVPLDPEHIERIIVAIEKNMLPCTKGPFFGTSQHSESQVLSDVATFQRALRWQNQPIEDRYRTVLYRASW